METLGSSIPDTAHNAKGEGGGGLTAMMTHPSAFDLQESYITQLYSNTNLANELDGPYERLDVAFYSKCAST